MNGIRTRRARRRKVVAISAAAAVVLAGATVTSLATWLDEEWVVAGVAGLGGVASSEFEIEQLVATDDPADPWHNRETAAAPAGVVSFDAIAATLSPGDVAYGWVQLRAAENSVAGTLTLAADYVAATSDLGDVLTYGARVHPTTATCNAADFAATGDLLVANDTAISTGSAATSFALAAGTSSAPGTAKTVCFRIEFPAAAADDTLQGLTASLGWHFEAESD